MEFPLKAGQAQSNNIDIILMDIDLGMDMDGTVAAMEISKYKDIPIVFLSSHTEKEIVEKTEKITSYGYVVKQSGFIVLDASIKMAFKLHRAHQELKESRERYRVLVENITSLVCETDSCGRYTYLSPAYEKITGWKPEELLGRYVIEHLHPDDVSRWKEKFFKIHKAKETIRDIWRFRIKDGQWRWMDSSVTFFEKNPGEIFCVVVTDDITERILEKNRMEMIIKENQEYLSEMKGRVKETASTMRLFVEFLISSLKDNNSPDLLVNIQQKMYFCIDLYERFHSLSAIGTVSLLDFFTVILSSIVKTYKNNHHNVIFDDELKGVALEIKWVLPVGLIINEILISIFENTPPKFSNNVCISAKKDCNSLVLCVQNSGCPKFFLNEWKFKREFAFVNKILEQIHGSFNMVCYDDVQAVFQVKFHPDEN